MKRSSLLVLFDIAVAVRDNPGVIQNDLLRKANVSGGRGHSSIPRCVASGLLREEVYDRGTMRGCRYFLTEKGYSFISDFIAARELLRKYGLEEGVSA